MTTILPLAQDRFGTIPDWIAALGTVAAFGVALQLLAKELAARREVEQDRRRAQARLVAGWMISKRDSDSHLHPYVVMKNGSDEPVYDGRCVVVPSTSRFASDPEAIFEPGRPEDTTMEFRWLMLPPHEIREGDLLRELWTTPWEAAIGLSFTDSRGRRWKRLPDGTLVESARRRRSRKDFMNAWIAGELDRLDY